MRLYILMVISLTLGICSCQKKEINPVTASCPPPVELSLDSTYGDYHLVNMIYVDSLGDETSNPTSNMDVTITTTDITLYQSGTEVESFPYIVTSTMVDTILYDITGGTDRHVIIIT